MLICCNKTEDGHVYICNEDKVTLVKLIPGFCSLTLSQNDLRHGLMMPNDGDDG